MFDEKGKSKGCRIDNYNGTFPPLGPLSYLYSYLCESGPLASWGDIKAWQECTSTPLEPYEAKLLWEMSCAYLGERSKGRVMSCPRPWVDESDEALHSVENNLKSFFRGLK